MPVLLNLIEHLIINSFEALNYEVSTFVEMTGESVTLYYNDLIKQAPEPAQLKITYQPQPFAVMPDLIGHLLSQ